MLAEVRGASWAPNKARVIDVPDTDMPRAAANRNVNAKGGAMPLAWPLPLTLRLAGDGSVSGSTAPITRAPLGAQEAPRTSASTSPFCSASASKKMRHSPSTALGSPR